MPPPAEDALLQPQHFAPAAVAHYKEEFKRRQPFPHLQLHDVVDAGLLTRVEDDLMRQRFTPKDNDLYQFHQSADLRTMASEAVAELRTKLYAKPFRDWIQAVTGVAVNETVDMSSAVYGAGDYLLCHDDDLSERRIAYIIYLVSPEWSDEDGGTLDLFACDDKRRPTKVVTRLTPAWNSMSFFSVSDVSHHQVAEVVSNKCGPRLSVSGWFHGKPVKRHPFPLLPALKLRSVAPATPSLLRWISPQWFVPAVVEGAADHCRANSSIDMREFLLPERYAAVTEALCVQRWTHVGPPNVRHHKVCRVEGDAYHHGILPDILADLEAMLTSSSFSDFLRAISGFKRESVVADVRCFARGDYTLVCDPEYRAQSRAAKRETLGGGSGSEVESLGAAASGDSGMHLDATLSFVSPGGAWEDHHGGFLTYLTSDDVLLTVPVTPNCLSIVVRESGVMSFVKYVGYDAPGTRFDIAMTSPVVPDDKDEDEEEDDDEEDDEVESSS